jgi:hypothetical protein
MELTDGEVELIRVARLTRAQRDAERRARADAVLAKARSRMKPDELAAYDAERERVANLSPAERTVEVLIAQKSRIETELAKPELAVAVSKLSDGIVVSEKEA